jgi:hypothetical protein
MISASPMNAQKISARSRAKLEAGGIPTPMGSDISRAKFDFSGYNPDAMRKKKPPSPKVNVVMKDEDDMEVLIG